MTANERVTVSILETSDIHGNIFPINYGNNEKMNVGLGKIATLIKQERQKSKYTVLVDNGDLIQGTPLMYHYVRNQKDKKNPMILLLNKLRYDAAIIGNHEFNYGLDTLKAAVEQSYFPWLSANILDQGTNKPFFGKPYTIKTFENGLKIAIFGVTTHYIPNWESEMNIKGLQFENALESTKQWVAYIRQQEQPDLLIVSYHGGFERDLETGEVTEALTTENQGYQICQEVAGIDVLLTGHQHRSISSKEINGVTVVQPSFNGQALGKVTIIFERRDDGWVINNKSSELLSTENVVPDQEVLTLSKLYEQQTQSWLDQPIGKIIGDMTVQDALDVRIKDHPLIEFINKVQMEVAGVEISNTALFHNQSPGFGENVTMRDIVSNYVYPNTLKVVRISGQDIKDALEKSASYFKIDNNGDIAVNPQFSEPKPQHYNYDMWEGIKYKLNISRSIGKRVVKLDYKGMPMNMAAQFDVVMNNYRAGGGGEYTMYQNKPVIKEIQMDMSELLANYILERGVIEATVNHNWEVTW